MFMHVSPVKAHLIHPSMPVLTSHSAWQRVGSAQHGLPEEMQNHSLVLPHNPEPAPLLTIHQSLNRSSYHLPGAVQSALYNFI